MIENIKSIYIGVGYALGYNNNLLKGEGENVTLNGYTLKGEEGITITKNNETKELIIKADKVVAKFA